MTILLPEGVEPNQEPEQSQEINPLQTDYQATEEDEERFFLMYHMNMQPSEVEKLKASYRKWLIMRFIGQKNLEQEAMERHKLMARLGPNLKG